MSLDNPAFLWLLLLLPLEFLLALRGLRRLSPALGVLAPPAAKEAALRRRKLAAILSIPAALVFISATVLALAGPTWGKRAERVTRSGLEVALVLDVSRSMETRDAVQGSRLEGARALVRLLLAGSPGVSFSLSIAKGDGLLLVPMTEDLEAVDAALDWAEPSAMSSPGTDLGRGIESGLGSFTGAANPSRVLVLLSDGGDLGAGARAAAVSARSRGIRILAVGFGGPEPAPVPGPDGKTLAGPDGLPVRTALEAGLLRALALASEGRYFEAADGGSIAGLRDELGREGRGGTRTVLRVRERASLFAALALVALALRLGLAAFARTMPPSPARRQGAGR